MLLFQEQDLFYFLASQFFYCSLMKLFLNDIFVLIEKKKGDADYLNIGQNFGQLRDIRPQNLPSTWAVNQTSEEDMRILLSWIELKKIPQVQTVVCRTEQYDLLKEFVKKQFRIIHAAGGLVLKRDKFLMIYRLGKWDLPKGKLERNEKAKIAAVREVEEECGVEAEIIEKLCTTWHSYIQDGKKILKKTSWYVLNCLDDLHMEPQYTEHIEDVRWMNQEEASKALKNSYRSIQGVFEAWQQKQMRLKEH